MKLTRKSLGDLIHATVIANEEEETIWPTVCENNTFRTFVETFLDELLEISDEYVLLDKVKTFGSLCLAVGWYARDAHDSTRRVLQPAPALN